MDSFTIKDLENLSGVKAHTIRIWEQRYQFLKPCRTCTNIRYYSNEELKKLLNIALLNKHGYKISHINKMCEVEVKEKILTLSKLEAQQETIINDLVQCMVELDLEKLENILEDHISLNGIEKTITQVIFPLLKKIGILWITNCINPAQEHLVSNIIRQKLIVGIDRISTSLVTDKKVLLFLPEGEHHELGILFINYLLKSNGIATIYLGTDISLDDMLYVMKLKAPDYIYCHLTCVCKGFNFDAFVSTVSKKISETPLIISGQLTNTYHKKTPRNIQLKKSFSEVTDFINGLTRQKEPASA